jgi:GNAT superfamily N-acetyltransferase
MLIRPARAGDHAAYARLFAELGVPDPLPSAEQFAQTIVPQMSVACGEGGEVVAYASWRPYGTVAHVIQIAVDPQLRGRRIGEQLLMHLAGEARAAGCTRWYLNVKRDNQPAIRLYERVGFRFELESVLIRIAWSCVPSLDVHAGLAEPAEDAAIAGRFDLPLERIAMFRARPSYCLPVVRDDGGVIAFAAFDPSFPGAATFCAVTPQLAAALLVAMRAQADPRFDFVRVTVEGNRALADAVLALGGTCIFEILRLGAAL